MADVTDQEGRRPGFLEPACLACGYDLRASGSIRCPECGTPRALRLDFELRDQLERAVRALGERGLARRWAARGVAGAAGDPIAGVPRLGGSIWIDATAADEAIEVLGAAGVTALGLALPIVDRAEPQCPRCGADLDPRGTAICPRCGESFEWVSIESAEAGSPDSRPEAASESGSDPRRGPGPRPAPPPSGEAEDDLVTPRGRLAIGLAALLGIALLLLALLLVARSCSF